MTQNTQTTTEMPTADRIEGIIVCNFEFDRFGRVTNTNHDKSAQTIAAEIDALRDEAKAYREGYNRLTNELDALRAGNAVSDRREIDALTAERDGSFKIQDRLESENLTLTVQLAEARAVNQSIVNANHRFTEEISALTAERNEARARNAELSTELAGANFEGNLAMIQRDEARDALSAWRTMFPVNTPAEIAAKLVRGG